MTEEPPIAEGAQAPVFDDATTEVWLLDTGTFVVLDAVHRSWRRDWRWLRRMRQRRVLRMFVPVDEIQNLPRIEKAFFAAKRGFEIRDAVAKGSRDVLRAIQGLVANLPAESGSLIKMRPYEPPKPVPMPDPAERAKIVAALAKEVARKAKAS